MQAKLLGCALGLAVMSAVGLNAQVEIKRTTKVEVKGGKEITTTGWGFGHGTSLKSKV